MYKKFYTWRSYDSIYQKKIDPSKTGDLYISTFKDFQRKIIFPRNSTCPITFAIAYWGVNEKQKSKISICMC